MVTPQNVQTEFPKIQATLTGKNAEVLNKHFERINNFVELYGRDDAPNTTEYVDIFCKLVNIELEKQEAKKISEKEESPKEKSQNKEEKPKTEKPAPEVKYVETISPEVKFISRYVKFNKKTISSDLKSSANTLLASLQKAITAKEIRQSSPYAKEIMSMQRNLVAISKDSIGTKINIEGYESLLTISKSQEVSDKIVLIKRVIALQGKVPDETKLRKLYSDLSKYKDDSDVITALAALDHYLTKGGTVQMDALTLQGLMGIAGIKIDDIKSTARKAGDVISSSALLAARFAKKNFTGMWKKLIGEPTVPFKTMIYGKPGSGKSTLSLRFAGYLAKLGMKVLYISQEEGFSYTLQEKLVRLDAHSPNLFVSDKIPATGLTSYDVVFFDSVTSLNLTPEDLRTLPENINYVFILQTTKDGHFRGSQEFEHDVDTVVNVDNFKATTGKNRFGVSGIEVKVM